MCRDNKANKVSGNNMPYTIRDKITLEYNCPLSITNNYWIPLITLLSVTLYPNCIRRNAGRWKDIYSQPITNIEFFQKFKCIMFGVIHCSKMTISNGCGIFMFFSTKLPSIHSLPPPPSSSSLLLITSLWP